MADFSIALEQLRGALETSEGNGDTPTRIIPTGPPGNVDASGVLKRVTIEDRRAAGTRTSLRGVYSGIESSDLAISNVPADYNNVGWWLSMIAPSGCGTGTVVDTNAQERDFIPVEGTAVNTFGGTAGGYYTANLQYSSEDFASTLVYQMPAMRLNNLTVRFDKRASGTDTGCMLDLGLTMSQGTATKGTSFDGSLSQVTPTLVIGNQLTAYIDSSYGSIGTTSDDQVMAAQFSLDLPVTYHDGMDGSNAHTSAHYAQQWTPSLSITRRFSDLDEFDAYTAKTTRAIRIEALGDVVGAATAQNTLRFDFVCKPTDHRLTQVDGLYYAEIDFEAIYDSTLTTSWSAYLMNDITAAYTAT